MTHPFFTIGHSTHSIADFVELLREADIKLVVDIRTVPRSRTNPQFNRDVLPITLSEFAIDYVHISQLGGLRAKSTTVPPSMNAFWQNVSFHNYADYAMSEDFKSGLMQLRELGHAKRSAIMCAEAVWWRCHRRIIADYLLAGGDEVFHILGRNHVDRAHMTPEANLSRTGVLTYPADAVQSPAIAESDRRERELPSAFEKVRFGSLADITARSRHVRFTLDSGHSSVQWDVRKVPEADTVTQSLELG